MMFIVFTSCMKEYDCVCTDSGSANGTVIISVEKMNGTKNEVKVKCAEKWCGDECGCSIQ